MTHPLVAYLDSKGETVNSFAKRIGVPQASLSRAIAGHRGLSLDVAVRVSKATEGAVPVEIWIWRRRQNQPVVS